MMMWRTEELVRCRSLKGPGRVKKIADWEMVVELEVWRTVQTDLTSRLSECNVDLEPDYNKS